MPFSVLVTFSFFYLKLGGAFADEKQSFYFLFFFEGKTWFLCFNWFLETMFKILFIYLQPFRNMVLLQKLHYHIPLIFMIGSWYLDIKLLLDVGNQKCAFFRPLRIFNFVIRWNFCQWKKLILCLIFFSRQIMIFVLLLASRNYN